MKFKFECPTCGQRISATEADVNTVGSCPACQGQFRVHAPVEALGAVSGLRTTSAVRPVTGAVPMTILTPAAGPVPAPAGGMLGWSILALVFCVLPIASIPVLAKTSIVTEPMYLKLLFAAMGLLSVAGLLIAHRAFQRNAQPGFGWVIPALGLIFGYLGAAYLLVIFAALLGGHIAPPIRPLPTLEFTAHPSAVRPLPNP